MKSTFQQGSKTKIYISQQMLSVKVKISMQHAKIDQKNADVPNSLDEGDSDMNLTIVNKAFHIIVLNHESYKIIIN